MRSGSCLPDVRPPDVRPPDRPIKILPSIKIVGLQSSSIINSHLIHESRLGLRYSSPNLGSGYRAPQE
jgi:hypothetical protein